MPISRIFERELEPPHERILNVMKEDTFLSLEEITKAIVKEYPKSLEVVKWKGRIGDISRYQVARYLKTLEREGYVESNNEIHEKWKRLREDSLLNDVVQSFVFEGRAKSRIEALKKLAHSYVNEHEIELQQYVSAVRRAKKIDELKTKEFKIALQDARSIIKRLQSSKVEESESNF